MSMRILEPSIELWEPKDSVSHIARCARVCYGKESGDDQKLYNTLLESKHHSVFRHYTFYAVIPYDAYPTFLVNYIRGISYDNYNVIGIAVKDDDKARKYYVAYNGQFALDCPTMYNAMIRYHVLPEEFNCYDLKRYTFKVVTQISTSRELNRVSPNSITEQSTRYVDMQNGAIVCPHWLTKYPINLLRSGVLPDGEGKEAVLYIESCVMAFDYYKKLVDLGLKKEDARGVLPLDTATTVIYTYSIEEWREIINKRVNHLTGRAHENAKIVCEMIKNKLNSFGYVI